MNFKNGSSYAVTKYDHATTLSCYHVCYHVSCLMDSRPGISNSSKVTLTLKIIKIFYCQKQPVNHTSNSIKSKMWTERQTEGWTSDDR